MELALVLPLLVFLFALAVDFGRVYHFSLTLQNSARAGAMFASDPHTAHESPYASAEEAVLADAGSLDPQPTIVLSRGTDSSGVSYEECTVTHVYRTVTQFPGIPHEIKLSRSVRMFPSAIVPDTQ